MAQRGRPRHPDILTPREWEVLALVREGLSNPQIGERLSISADAAKYHVSEILSKLGVSSREEAAAWRPEPSEAPVLRPVWARVLPVAALAGAAVALAGVGLLAWGVLRSSGEDDGTPSPTISSLSPSPTSTTGLLDLDPPAQTLVVGEPAKLAGTYALIMETGCTQCDGSTSGINRFYLDGRGNYQTEHLYSTGTHFFRNGSTIRTEETYRVGLAAAGDVPAGSLYITGFAVANDG